MFFGLAVWSSSLPPWSFLSPLQCFLVIYLFLEAVTISAHPFQSGHLEREILLQSTKWWILNLLLSGDIGGRDHLRSLLSRSAGLSSFLQVYHRLQSAPDWAREWWSVRKPSCASRVRNSRTRMLCGCVLESFGDAPAGSDSSHALWYLFNIKRFKMSTLQVITKKPQRFCPQVVEIIFWTGSYLIQRFEHMHIRNSLQCF